MDHCQIQNLLAFLNLLARKIFAFLIIISIIVFTSWSCKNSPTDPGRIGPIGANDILFTSEKDYGTSEGIHRIYQLYSMNADGSDAHELEIPGSKNISEARWSPKGDKIAYVDAMEGLDSVMANISMIDIYGKVAKLANMPYLLDEYAYGPQSLMWLANGHELLFDLLSSSGSYGSSQVLILDTDWKNVRTFINTNRLLVPYSNSSNGDYIYVCQNDPLAIARVRMTDASKEIIQTPGIISNFPIISHNGAKIALSGMYFSSDTSGGTSHLFIMNTDGTNLHRVTPTRYNTESPVAWSPDDKYILMNVEYLNTTLGYYVNHIVIVDCSNGSMNDITPGSFPEHSFKAQSWRY
jgi:Tol biopolymer transport system component